jgi:hypothetical protein
MKKSKRPAQVQGQSQNRDKDKQFRDQFQTVYQSLLVQPKTMLQVSRETNIERANICWYVRDMREHDQVAVIKHGICPVSRHRAGFLTTDPNLFPLQSVQPTLFGRKGGEDEQGK